MNNIEKLIELNQPGTGEKLEKIRKYLEGDRESSRKKGERPYKAITCMREVTLTADNHKNVFATYLKELRDCSVICDFTSTKVEFLFCDVVFYRDEKETLKDGQHNVKNTMGRIRSVIDTIIQKDEMTNIQWIDYMENIVDKYNEEIERMGDAILF